MDEGQVLGEVAGLLRMLLGEITAGELGCSPATRHRIEGAALALDPPGRQSVAQTGQPASGAP